MTYSITESPTIERGKFLVVAASCRTIAQSISKAGYDCVGVDLFADSDAREICPVHKATSLEKLIPVATQIANAEGLPVVCGAGVNQVCSENTVFGTSRFGPNMSSVEAARNPHRIAELLKREHLPSLAVRLEKPLSGSWINKPFDSGGGHNVTLFEAGPNATIFERPKMGRENFFQEFVAGPVYGASFIGHRNGCQLIGVCSQLVRPLGSAFADAYADTNTNAKGLANAGANSIDSFIYHGSIGPIELPGTATNKLRRMGSLIANDFQLHGWFGIDFVLADDTVWLLEINPRYTASMEILERVIDQSLFELHYSAIEDTAIDFCRWNEPVSNSRQLIGKRYVFNRSERSIMIDSELSCWLRELEFVTDIPVAGSVILPEYPVCTVWANGSYESLVESELNDLDHAVFGKMAIAAGP